MKKLALNIEDLEVESFETRIAPGLPGTVHGRDAIAEPAPESDPFCTAFCKTVNALPCDTELCKSNQYTCAHSCTAIICINF